MTRRWASLVAIAGVGAALDQTTKAWAVANLRDRGIVSLVDGLLEFRYVRNPGAFFGLGGDLPAEGRRWLFCAAAVGVGILLLRTYARAAPGARRLRAGLALLLAGAMGNLVDRLRYGDVVDFLHLRLGELFHWATFNLADVYIAAGLVLLAIEFVRGPSRQATLPAAAGEKA